MDNPSISSNMVLLDQCIVHRCADYNSDNDELKISGVQYNNLLVTAQNLIGTMIHMNIHCSKAVYQKFLEFTKDDAGEDDVEKAMKVKAILWVEHYYPGSQWSMDDRGSEWDEAVSTLLDRRKAALR